MTNYTMVFHVNIIYRCLWPKTSVKIEIAYRRYTKSHNRVEQNFFFFTFCQQKHLYCFARKVTGLVKQALCITYQVKRGNRENCLNKGSRKYDARSFQWHRACSKLNEIVPSALLYDCMQ